MVVRSAERTEFLQDIFHAAIESGSVGWFTVNNYKWLDLPAEKVFAYVTEREDGTIHRIDIDLIAKGLGVISGAEVDPDIRSKFMGNLVNGFTREILYMHSDTRKMIMQASRDNDAGDIDACLALAIVECGLFGRVIYG